MRRNVIVLHEPAETPPSQSALADRSPADLARAAAARSWRRRGDRRSAERAALCVDKLGALHSGSLGKLAEPGVGTASLSGMFVPPSISRRTNSASLIQPRLCRLSGTLAENLYEKRRARPRISER